MLEVHYKGEKVAEVNNVQALRALMRQNGYGHVFVVEGEEKYNCVLRGMRFRTDKKPANG